MAKLNTGRSEKQHNVDFAKGGKGKDNHMFPAQSADPAEKAVTRDTNAADQAPHPAQTGEAFGAKGGGGKMFGYAGSQPAQAGITSAR